MKGPGTNILLYALAGVIIGMGVSIFNLERDVVNLQEAVAQNQEHNAALHIQLLIETHNYGLSQYYAQIAVDLLETYRYNLPTLQEWKEILEFFKSLGEKNDDILGSLGSKLSKFGDGGPSGSSGSVLIPRN